MQHIIIPGLVVTEHMYAAAAEGVDRHAPEVGPLTWERWTDPRHWTLVPDDHGQGYKAEHVLHRSGEATYKLNVWMLPDRRGGARPMPHSHPWDFTAHVLMGGYDEDRYTPTDGTPIYQAASHPTGGHNHIDRATFHEVTRIWAPGQTVTLMTCGTGTKAEWGYLDTDTGQFTMAAPDPHFATRLRALNPHKS